MNTKPVDVLAVLDKVSGKLDFFGYADLENHLESARAAIAELIAADEEYDAAIAAQYKAKSTKAWRTAADRAEAALDRRAVAIARVKGKVA